MPPRLTRNAPLALLLLSVALPAEPSQRLLAERREPVAAAASQGGDQTAPPGRRTVPAARGVPLEQAILAAEDSRAEDDAALAPFRQGLKGDVRLQVLAVRALGRLERASLVPAIAPMLDSPMVAVRVEAANALGQAVMRGDAGPASVALTARARTELDARVLAAIARTLGRLSYQQESEIRDAERSMLAIADRAVPVAASAESGADRVPAAVPNETGDRATSTATSPPARGAAPPTAAARRPLSAAAAERRASGRSGDTPNEVAAADGDETIILAGVAHGLDALARRAVKLGSLSADTRSRLRKLARHGLGADGKEAASAPPADAAAPPNPPRDGTGASRAADAGRADTLTNASERAASSEPAARVRRLAVSALVTARESNVPLLREVMRDPDDQVRRLAIVWLGATEDMPLRDEAFRQAFADGSAMVRYEVLRTYSRVRQTSSAGAAGPRARGAAATALRANRSDAPSSEPASAGGAAPTAGAASAPSNLPATTAEGGPSADAASAHAAPARSASSSALATPTDAGSSAGATSMRAAPASSSSSPSQPAAGTGECALEVKALEDASANVGLLAIDALGRCGERDVALERLMPIVAELGDAPRAGRAQGGAAQGAAQSGAQGWHRPAHALVAIARLAPDRAAAPLARAASHEVWQVRMYAARAAGVLKDRATLDALAADGEDNVREAAIEALQALVGHEADGQYLAALDRSDPQLLRTAARALAGTAQKTEAAARLLKTFVRVSAARHETSRDVRLALLDSLDSLGRAPVENAIDMLRPYLTDFDPVVARRVAAILTAWTDQTHVAAPTRLPSAAVPSPREIERMARTRAVVRMARGATFTLALRPDVAPTNVARFLRLARAGTFNGLTFHRVEPNFVLQGGSPAANEYAGDGPFTRDELDLTSNLRGTVGVSTRGRDTGDGQLYVNLVDNARLDHNYTVFAEIVEGLPAIDEILEGDVIARIELRERP